MKVLVTGASGYVGAKLYQDLKDSGEHEVIGTCYGSNRKPLFPELEMLNIRDVLEVYEFFQRTKPEVVVHTAANSSASWCEKNIAEAVNLNFNGTFKVVLGVREVGAKLIYISSFAAIEPDNVYGYTKALGEKVVRKEQDYVVVRASTIYGQSPNTQNDRPHNRLLRSIEGCGPEKYEASIRFQPTWLRHLSEVVREVIKRDIKDEVIPVAVKDLMTRFEIAGDILRGFGVEVKPDYHPERLSKDPVDLSKLAELDLPRYDFEVMLPVIVEEINRYLGR